MGRNQTRSDGGVSVSERAVTLYPLSVDINKDELKAVERMLKAPAPQTCPAGAPEAPAGACARGTHEHTLNEPEDLQDAFGGPAGA